MSKYQLKISDIYYPNSNILKNKLNIKDAEILHDIEAELLIEAMKYFSSNLNINTKFDEKYYKSLHKQTFISLYEWAGKYRDFDMANGYKPIDYSLFSPNDYIQASIECVQYADNSKLFEIIYKGLGNDN